MASARTAHDDDGYDDDGNNDGQVRISAKISGDTVVGSETTETEASRRKEEKEDGEPSSVGTTAEKEEEEEEEEEGTRGETTMAAAVLAEVAQLVPTQHGNDNDNDNDEDEGVAEKAAKTEEILLERGGREHTNADNNDRRAAAAVAALADHSRGRDAVGGGGGGGAAGGRASDVEMVDSATTYKVYKRRWFGIVQLMLLNIIVSWDWFTFAPVAGDSAAYFDTDEAAVNWFSTGFLFAFCLVTPLTIYVLHLGPKLSIVMAAGLLLVGSWVRYAGAYSASGGNFGVVLFGQILIGFGQPFVLAAPTRYSDLWFTNRGRVVATALMSLANPFGGAIGQLVTPFWVNQSSDVSHVVLYMAIISTVACIPAFFVPSAPPTPVAPSSETPKLSLRASIRELSCQAEFWLILIPFSVYVGFFNAITSVLNQVLSPYGFSDTESGIAGALLIVVGLVSSAVTSPILDRTKSFVTTIKLAVPILGICYLVLVWMPATTTLPGPYVVLCLLGAASFSLVPVVVECLVELTHPVSPEVTSTLAWSGGQLFGGIFIVIMNALKAPADASPPYNMTNALIFEAVVSLAVVPLPLCLGLFGRGDRVLLRRVRSDEVVIGDAGGRGGRNGGEGEGGGGGGGGAQREEDVALS